MLEDLRSWLADAPAVNGRWRLVGMLCESGEGAGMVLVAADPAVESEAGAPILTFISPGDRVRTPAVESISLAGSDFIVGLWSQRWRLFYLDIASGLRAGLAAAEGMHAGDPQHEAWFAANFDGTSF